MFDGLRLALIRRLDKLTGLSATHTPQPISPAEIESLRTQGNAFIAEEKLDKAESCFRDALSLQADDTRLQVCLGYVLKEQGRFAEARIVLRRAAIPGNTDPQAFEAYYLLGQISEQQSDLEDAKRNFTATLEMKPDFTRACQDVVRVLHFLGRESEITAFLEDRVQRFPDVAEYRLLLAKACTDAFDFQGTAEHLMAAVALGVDDVRINITVGAALCRLEREEESRKYFEMALAADPSVAYEIEHYKGYFHLRSGNAGAAVACLEQSLALQPDFVPSHSLLLLNLSHTATELNRSYQEAAQRFATAIESAAIQLPASTPGSIDQEKKVLRIGFVAGEFREHPIYHFLVGVLEHIDKTRFHLVAFSNTNLKDAATVVFKTLFNDWHDIRHLSHDTVTDLVRAQGIDVLIDLSGHTGDGRLPVFARKPALVQVAWLGYFASTGLTTMDYIIADAACVPVDSAEWFSEKVIRLPATRLCMTAPRTSRPIPVAQAPCKTKGYVTFGSFQQAAKINAQVLLVWAQVMTAVPQSRLRIQNKAIESAAIRRKICADMALAGIDLSRVELVGATGWEAYLEAHGEIDIVLDTFPYPGGTTTAFALWMGVPTVTLAGDTMLSLQGASMLGCVGLTDWIADNEAEYVEIASKFSSDTEHLQQLRQGLREVAVRSPLFDCKRFATDLQNALRSMYRERLAEIAGAPLKGAPHQ